MAQFRKIDRRATERPNPLNEMVAVAGLAVKGNFNSGGTSMTAKKYETTLHQQRAYREANREKLKEQQKQWRLKNPKKVKANSKAHSERRKGIVPHLPNPLPDKLLLTLHVRLTDAQREYLYQNKEMARPQLYKAFRKQFNSNINKLQFNFALEKIANKYIQNSA